MGVAQVRNALERHGLRARRDLGQNFLVDPKLAERLVTLAGVREGDTVVEVGTGLGALTQALAVQARSVVTLEVDAGLVRALRADCALPANVELLHADALRVDLPALLRAAPRPVRVVANLPYSISAPFLRRLLDLRGELEDWSVMVQREVADRLLAEPGSAAYGSLTVLHRLTVHLGRALHLQPGAFFPVPRVRSTFLRMRPLERPVVSPEDLPRVEWVVRTAFGQRRKTLSNALRGAATGPRPAPERIAHALAVVGIDPRARAESLPPATLLELARALGE